MHPMFNKILRDKLRRAPKADPARPHVMSAFGDFISSIGWAIKDRLGGENLTQDEAEEDVGNYPPYPPGGGGDGGAAYVQPFQPTKSRYQMLPLQIKNEFYPQHGYGNVEAVPVTEGSKFTEMSESLMVPPGCVAQLTNRAQAIFRPEQIMLDSEEAVFFDVIDIRVGKNSQLLAAGAIPAKFFHEGNEIRLKCDTAQVSMDISIMVVNKSAEPRKLHGALLGPMVE
jgi:hypothetical protein